MAVRIEKRHQRLDETVSHRSACSFIDGELSGARIADGSLAGVSIWKSHIEGRLTIGGIAVTDTGRVRAAAMRLPGIRTSH